MAIAVSQPFLDAVDDVHKLVIVLGITVLRRKKAVGFPFEVSPLVLDESEFKAISPIVKKFDVQKQNKINVSNLTLTLDNENFQWDEFNKTSGRWRPDAGSSLGYDPKDSEFAITLGVVIASDPDTDPETIQIFKGRLVDFIQDTKSGTVQIFLKGFEVKLQEVDSQKVNTLLVDAPATPALGDGFNPTFELAPSLFDIQQVRALAAVKLQGPDYKLSQTNDADLNAIAKFEPGKEPGLGDPVDFSARQWKRNLSVSAFLGLVADAAGILPGDRSIIEPNYPAVSQFVEYGLQAEWDAAVKVETDSVFFPGKLTLGTSMVNGGFESGDLTQWTPNDGGGATAWSVSGPGGAGTENFFATALIGKVGATGLKYEVRIDSAVPTPGSFGAGNFKNLSPDIEWTNESIDIPPGLGAKVFVTFVAYDSGDQNNFTSLTTDVSSKRPQTVTFQYKNQGLITIPENSAIVPSLDAVRMLGTAAQGTALTDEIDFSVVPEGMQPILVDAVLNGGTISKIETQSSVLSGGPFSALAEVDGANVPVSPLRQFWKVKFTLDSNLAETDGPVLDFFRIQFLASTLLLGHADTTQKDGYQTFQRLAEITGSEFGFDNNSKLFFRPKSVSIIPILELTQDNYIIDVTPAKPGYRDVKNIVQVSYGPYYEEVNSATQGEVFPNNSQERFGDRILPLSINDFAFANNANFAGAIAALLFDLLSKPKRKGRIICRLIPQLDLSDVVLINYSDSELNNPVYGDPLNPKPSFGPSGNVLYRDVLAKIIGIEHDFESGRTNLDIEEVLTS